MSVEFRFLELEHYDNDPHFKRFAKVADARRREATLLFPAGVQPGDYFNAFLQRAVSAIDQRRYLPVARFCDGEYRFYNGEATTTCWGEQQSDLKSPGVEQLHIDALRVISEEGLLCPNLNQIYLGMQSDFLEFLSRNGMALRNYAPFYFVYALLVNPAFLGALSGRSVALISNFANKNLGNIRSVLELCKVREIEICEIPASGVAHGKFELNLTRRPDVAFVGAGIGSPLVLAALRSRSCVAIDSGFVYHLWDGTFDRYERLFLNYV